MHRAHGPTSAVKATCYAPLWDTLPPGGAAAHRHVRAPDLEIPMAWIVLVVSGLFEAVWATALGRSAGLTKLTPSIVFLVTVIISMFGLAFAMKTLPTGTSYAVWVGIGASTTVIYAMATGAEPFHILRLLLVLGIVACVVGLKLIS